MKLIKRKTGSMMAAALLLGLPIGGIALARQTSVPAPAVQAQVASAQVAQAVQARVAPDVARQGPPPQATPEPNEANEPAETGGANEANEPAETGETNEQDPAITGSIPVQPGVTDGKTEAEEQAALQALATISPEQAQAAAVAANPGTTATKVELGAENGFLVYDVELSNGLELKVDAGDAKILHTEQAGADNEVGEQDELNEGPENEANEGPENEANEAPEAPAAPKP